MSDVNLPTNSEKPSLFDWLEEFLPFRLPRIPLARTAANLDKAAAMIVLSGGQNMVARIHSSTTRVNAQASAERSFIELGQSKIVDGSSELANRALGYVLGDALRKQENREEILRLATEDLASGEILADANQEIDTDWLNSFSRWAEDKSTEDVKQLWAKILSAEIRKPGTTSLRTLSFLSTTSATEANEIATAFRYVVDGDFIPSWIAERCSLSFSSLLGLQDLGILTGVGAVGLLQKVMPSESMTIDGVAFQGAKFIYQKKGASFSIFWDGLQT